MNDYGNILFFRTEPGDSDKTDTASESENTQHDSKENQTRDFSVFKHILLNNSVAKHTQPQTWLYKSNLAVIHKSRKTPEYNLYIYNNI